jgi:hypothetical protein
MERAYRGGPGLAVGRDADGFDLELTLRPFDPAG